VLGAGQVICSGHVVSPLLTRIRGLDNDITPCGSGDMKSRVYEATAHCAHLAKVNGGLEQWLWKPFTVWHTSICVPRAGVLG
jgi:hypothetical protein